MIKKILLVVVAVLVAGGALVMYGTYKAADDILKEHEPQLRQYVQMSVEEQNKYVMEHAAELLSDAVAKTPANEKADVEVFEKTKDDPAAQKALLEFGRSFMAQAIVHSEAIVKDLSAKTKADYEKESEEFSARLDKYNNILEEAQKKIQAVK